MSTKSDPQPYRPTMLGYKKKPELINPDSLLPAEKRKAQLDNWRTYDKKMNLIEKQKAEEEARQKAEAQRLAEEQAKLAAEAASSNNDDNPAETDDNSNETNKENVPENQNQTLVITKPSEPEEGSAQKPGQSPAPEEKKKRSVKFHSDAVFLACCAADDIDDVTAMLAAGQDVNTRNADGLTALHTACIDGKYKMCELLVQHKANINAADNEGWTPLHAAAGSGHLRIANFLVGHMANVEAVNCEGNMASDVTEDRACKLLLDGALLRKRIRNDEDKAKARRIEETMINEYVDGLVDKYRNEPSLAASEDPDLKLDDKTGGNLLHVCASKGYTTALRLLLVEMKQKLGVKIDVQAKDEDFWTPLHAASHWEKQPCIDLLIEAGADLLAKNRFSQNPIDVMSNDSPLYNGLTAKTEKAKREFAEQEKLRRQADIKRQEEESLKEAQRLRELADQQIQAEKAAREGSTADDDDNRSTSAASSSSANTLADSKLTPSNQTLTSTSTNTVPKNNLSANHNNSNTFSSSSIFNMKNNSSSASSAAPTQSTLGSRSGSESASSVSTFKQPSPPYGTSSGRWELFLDKRILQIAILSFCYYLLLKA